MRHDFKELIERRPSDEVTLRHDEYFLNEKVVVDRPLRLNMNGSTVKLGGGLHEKGLYVMPGTQGFVSVRDGRFVGDGSTSANDGPVITSYSGVFLETYRILNVTFKDLNYGCNFNCSAGGFIRQAVLEHCLFENIIGDSINDTYGNSLGPGSHPEKGKGAAFSFNSHNSCSGFSVGNSFYGCARHSLYCSTGGVFQSVGDAFYGNSLLTRTNWPLAAVSLARGSYMSVRDAVFHDCRDAVSITDSNGSGYNLGVSVSGCTFDGVRRYGILLGSADARKKHFRGVRFFNNLHRCYAGTSMPYALDSGRDVHVVDNVVIDDRVDRRSRLFRYWGTDQSGDIKVNLPNDPGLWSINPEYAHHLQFVKG